VWWSTLQCNELFIVVIITPVRVANDTVGDRLAVLNSIGQVNGRVSWSTLQCKWTIRCDDEYYIALQIYIWVINITVREERYIAVINNSLCNERYIVFINTTLHVNDTLLWSTIHWNWNLQCCDQHYSANERYSAVINSKVHETINALRWSTLQCKWTVQCDERLYSASQNFSTVIHTSVQVKNDSVRWS
jgi:hypothetical protein